MPSPRRRKDAIYEQFARIGKGVASPKRIELLDLLSQAPRTVEALAGEASLSIANASQHLQVLRATRLVSAEKRGLHVEYSLADEGVAAFLVSLRGLAEARLAEVDEAKLAYFADRGSMERVAQAELVRRVRSGAVTLIDVRPSVEFDAGHLPRAVSMPLAHLDARLGALPADREVVAYCRGPYCVMAAKAVALLRERGFDAQPLDLGVVEWRARGWRVVRPRAPARSGVAR